jgi:hypothetical protein
VERSSLVNRLLENIDNIHELGRQRAFELGNPFYAKHKGDDELYRKELPTGEQYLVKVEIITNNDGLPIEVKDTVIKQLN